MSKQHGQVSQTPCHPPSLCQCPSFTHTHDHLCRNLIQPDEEAKKTGFEGSLGLVCECKLKEDSSCIIAKFRVGLETKWR